MASFTNAIVMIERCLAEAARGDATACLDLGMVYSSGSGGIAVDLVQAHKWFNIAASKGSAQGQQCRTEIAYDMSQREIAEAQRQARAWLNGGGQRPQTMERCAA